MVRKALAPSGRRPASSSSLLSSWRNECRGERGTSVVAPHSVVSFWEPSLRAPSESAADPCFIAQVFRSLEGFPTGSYMRHLSAAHLLQEGPACGLPRSLARRAIRVLEKRVVRGLSCVRLPQRVGGFGVDENEGIGVSDLRQVVA